MEFIIYPPNSSIAFNVFNLPIRWYGIMMAISIFLGVILIDKLLKFKYSIRYSNVFSDNFPFIVILSIIGARLFYIIAKWDFYLNNLKEIILINHGGLSIFGALLFGSIAVYIVCKISKLNFLNFMDTIAVVMPLCQSIGRWGNYFNQEAYGRPSSFIIKLFVSKNYRIGEYIDYDYFHPAFLYESILDLMLFILLFCLFFKNKKLKQGFILYLYLFLYSIIRIIIESIRIDSAFNICSIPIASIISFIILIFSGFMLFKMQFKKDAI